MFHRLVAFQISERGFHLFSCSHRCSKADLEEWFIENEKELREIWASNLRFRLRFVPRPLQDPDAAPEYVAEWEHPLFEALFVRWTTRGVIDANAEAVRNSFLTRMNPNAWKSERANAKKQLYTAQLVLKNLLARRGMSLNYNWKFHIFPDLDFC